MGLEKLIKNIQVYNPDADVALIKKAYEFAENAHSGQFRNSGETFFLHPYEVAQILTLLELDVTTIAAGLLHDVLEDTPVTHEKLVAEFGEEIAALVDGVTKLSKIAFKSKEERQIESLRKMFLAMAQDIRVVLIRLADRLHNMRTLRHMPVVKQKKIAGETLEIYSPLAHRLGMWRIKWELEDLAFRYIEPTEYYRLAHKVSKQRREREGYIEDVRKALADRLEEMGIEAEIQGRPKHFYSIYQKMKEQGKSFEEIYDLIAIRVIVDTIKDCYAVLGTVHTLWKPLPGRFKDYIAMPKSNMYQSLHTTVIGPHGDPFEIQIRTWDMHRTAEYGIAAHWKYKEGAQGNSEFEAKIAWLRQLLEWQREMKDIDDFMETLKIDLFEDEVFVFTPKGDVKNLPAGSTPVDFAYAVHTDIGHKCVGAKVNGAIIPLDQPLKNGDIVEILTSRNDKGPSRDWLNFIKTSKAKGRIRQWFKDQRRDESIQKGKELIEREIHKYFPENRDALDIEGLNEAAGKFGFTAADDLLAAMGYGKVPVAQVVTKLFPEKVRELKSDKKPVPPSSSLNLGRTMGKGIRVKGVDNLMVRLSHCCNPVPGDEIIGYITRGRGVSVHRKDCSNASSLMEDKERLIEVEWDQRSPSFYPVSIEIRAIDRVELLANVVSAISETRTNINAINARTTRNKMAFINLIIQIDNVQQMNNIIDRIKGVNGVLDVYRAPSN